MRANASRDRNRGYESIVTEILREAERVDREIRPEGRQAWLRQARRDVEARREQDPWPVPLSRQERLVEAKRRLDDELAFEHAANEQYERYRDRA
jgi:hypothetical protein